MMPEKEGRGARSATANISREQMGVVTARILFLAFLVLTATIIYNALYLQQDGLHGVGSVPAVDAATQIIPVGPTGTNGASAAVQTKTGLSGRNAAPVSTDLPPGSGESRLVVRAVQRELAARGYDVGEVDGQLSGQTRTAISSFQKKEGLAVTGVPSDDLLRQILLGDSIAPSVTTGSVTASDSIAANAAEYGTIQRVQRVLAELGYAPGAIDGAWGEKTASAVRAFQRDRNLNQTGTVTPELLQEFQRVTGREFIKTAARP